MITPGSVVTCYVPDLNIEAGKQYTVDRVERRDPKVPEMIFLVGQDKDFAPFRFVPRAAPVWVRPDTSDLDPDQAELERFEAARQRAMKDAKAKKGRTDHAE